MNAIMLVIVLAHGGFWFGGEENALTMTWAADAPMPAAVVVWQVTFGEVKVAEGETELAGEGKETLLKLKLPEARAITAYTWKYTLKARRDGKALESGERTIVACPKNLLADVAGRVKKKTIAVLEPVENLTKALAAAGIAATRIDAPGDVQVRKVDIVLVGADALPESESKQRVLLDKAREGAGVMVFCQRKAREVLGVATATRAMKGTLAWKERHVLFDRLSGAAMESWAREAGDALPVLRLEKNAAIVELGAFARETRGREPAPVDALAATSSVGAGRVVWCQVPVESWENDPRAAILLANALDYLLMRPEPTPPQSQRAPEATTKMKAPGKTVTVGEQP